MLELRQRIDLDHEVTAAELEHEPALAEVTEAPGREVRMPAQQAALVELEATMRAMELCASVWRKVAKADAAIAGLGRRRCHRQCRQHCCEHHRPAHRLPLIERRATPRYSAMRGAGHHGTNHDSKTDERSRPWFRDEMTDPARRSEADPMHQIWRASAVTGENGGMGSNGSLMLS